MKSIALIDDNPVVHLIVKELVQYAKVADDFMAFEEAEKAAEYLQECIKDKKELPELILLDINLPGMDGWDFLNSYKEVKEKLPSVPAIYMLTSSISDKDKAKAAADKNVQGFITKPLTLDTLKKISQSG